MTVIVAHYGAAGRPPVGLPWQPPYLTRQNLEDATRGHIAAGPATGDIINDILVKQEIVAAINARLAAAGSLTTTDGFNLISYSAALQQQFQQIGLYPVDRL
jgi:hypothetical protein